MLLYVIMVIDYLIDTINKLMLADYSFNAANKSNNLKGLEEIYINYVHLRICVGLYN